MTQHEAAPLSRRERLRIQTLDEIEQHAFELVDAGGAHAVSLADIAKTMGMSAPALYRYFPSRDALLASLVSAAYADLAHTLEQTESDTAQLAPEVRLRKITAAYRQWALERPKRYTMIFGERPDDIRDTTAAITTINRGMQVLLTAVVDLPHTRPPGSNQQLDAQLSQWAGDREQLDAPPHDLHLALVLWTRLHGVVGLEIIGAFNDMHVDAGLLLDAEIDAIIHT